MFSQNDLPSHDAIRAALETVGNKYFGDYPLTVPQFDAIDVLERIARAHLESGVTRSK